jgi:ABC-type microcin C transport system permease subunit YejB
MVSQWIIRQLIYTSFSTSCKKYHTLKLLFNTDPTVMVQVLLIIFIIIGQNWDLFPIKVVESDE